MRIKFGALLDSHGNKLDDLWAEEGSWWAEHADPENFAVVLTTDTDRVEKLLLDMNVNGARAYAERFVAELIAAGVYQLRPASKIYWQKGT